MTRVRLAAVLLLAGLLPLTAGALGLGEITLRSGLNQPFVAEILVTADSAEELNQLSVQLAPAATFERFGLDRPPFLEDMSFQLQRDGSRTLVRVTSTRPVSEPFVSLLLDVGWPQGRLLREYTVLLDPPAFASREASGENGSRPVVAPPVAPGPATPAIRRSQAPEVSAGPGSPAPDRLTSGPGGDSYGPVRSNETLWGISERLRSNRNVSLNQMMLALYQANPEAFAGNINRLRRGAILRVPAGSDLTGVSNREASTEVQRQDQEWRSGAGVAPVPARLQLVPPAEEPSRPAPGIGTGAGAGPGIAPGPGSSPTPGADRPGMERELAEQQRLVRLKDNQLKELQDRLSRLEGRTTPAPAPGEVPAAVPPVDTTAETSAATEESPAVTPPATEARPAAKQSTRESRPGGGFLSSLVGLIFNVWFLVSAAVVLLAGLFFVFARRRMATADEAAGRFGNDLRGDLAGGAASTQTVVRRDGYSVEEGGSSRSQSTPAPTSGRAPTRDADAETPLERTISTEGAVELDQADVVAEADFHMAYGLYDQAAELLARALRDSPDRRDLRLKLLEVFFIWENKTAFLKEAQTFQRQLKGPTDPSWSKVVIMGKQICPGEPLFAGAVSTAGDEGLDLALADDEKGGVDISFDEGDVENLDLDLTAARKGPASDLLDFDLGPMKDGSVDDTSMMKTEISPRSGSQGGARTVEVPTVESRYVGDHAPTMETPAIASRGDGASTMETPTIESRDLGSSTMETPTLESAVPGLRTGAPDFRRAGGSDQTEEINLEDLGLDLTGLDEAAGELGTGVHAALDGDGDQVYDLGTAEDDASDLLQELEVDSTAEVPGMALDEGILDLPAFGNAMERSAANRDTGRDTGRDTTSETAEHRAVEDTAEQPRVSVNALGDASADLSQVDFDVGDGKAEDLESTSVMAGRRRGPEGPTMTEVGTKLDLARAYVDMGDPDGARSILNEVLEEGDSAQRQEARRLLDDLTD